MSTTALGRLGALGSGLGLFFGCGLSPISECEELATCPSWQVEAGLGGKGGSATGGSSGISIENCLNGADDDGDGKPDCADEDCDVDFECVDAPAGTGPYFRLYSSLYPNDTDPCENGEVLKRYYSEPIPANCSACSCGAATGTCKLPGLTCWTGSTNCSYVGGAEIDLFIDYNTPCNDHAKKPYGFSCAWSGEVINEVTCPSSGGALQDSNMWEKQLDTCALGAVGGGCDNGKVCAKKTTNSFGWTMCIRLDGNAQCNSGLDEFHGYENATDTRSCTPCTCTPGACQGGAYKFHDDMNCADAGIQPDSEQCINVNQVGASSSWSLSWIDPTPPTTCTPSGGQPQGQVDPTGPVTFCCK